MSNALSVVNADPRLREASFSFKMMFRFAKTAVATRARNVQVCVRVRVDLHGTLAS